jgi:RNA polymerase sigma-70 factor (sigma-E family)
VRLTDVRVVDGELVKNVASTAVPGDAFTAVYLANYGSLMRLAALLVDDRASCEDVVQDAYVRVYASRTKLRDETRALAYLRQTVVNLSRSSLRHTIMARRKTEPAPPRAGGPDDVTFDRIEQAAVVQALRRLPRRQREVLALRYYAELSETQVAESLGLSVGSVKAYASRGLDRLAQEMAGMT